MRRRAFIRTAAGLFVPAILGRAAVPMSISDPAFLGRHRSSGSAASDFAYEDFESYSAGTYSAASLTGFSGFAGAPTVYGTSPITIGNHTGFADGKGNYMLLDANEWVQELSIGSSWSHLRIGMLIAGASTSNYTANKYLIMAMCSGSTHPYGQAPATNVLGVNCTGRTFVGADGWFEAYDNGSIFGGQPVYYGNGGQVTFKNVSGTVTTGPGGASQVTAMAQGVTRKTAIFFDMTKGSPNYTVAIYGNQLNGNINNDFQKTDFLAAMQVASFPTTINGVVYGQSNNSGTLAFSEAGGALDHIDIYWPQAGQQYYLYALAAYKLA